MKREEVNSRRVDVPGEDLVAILRLLSRDEEHKTWDVDYGSTRASVWRHGGLR
jgi:hypothetical protein